MSRRDSVGSPALTALLHGLPPERRLALRAHLDDSGILDGRPLDPAHAASLLDGLRWLVERLGPEGIEQNEHRELPNWVAREAEAALAWESTPESPASPGHSVIALARSARFVRRLRGRILPTARTRTLAVTPVRSVADVRTTFGDRVSRYTWMHDHAQTLALLAIADGSAFDAADAVRHTVDGLRVLASHEPGDIEERARSAVQDLMTVLAPLGGRGSYGRLTPAVRAFARTQLTSGALPGSW